MILLVNNKNNLVGTVEVCYICGGMVAAFHFRFSSHRSSIQNRWTYIFICCKISIPCPYEQALNLLSELVNLEKQLFKHIITVGYVGSEYLSYVKLINRVTMVLQKKNF